jgi:hypothetical protein
MAINKQNLELYPSWIQRIQEGFRFNLILLGTNLVLPPSTQALEVSDSSNLSPSPTLRDSSGVGIVSSSSLVDGGLDGSGVDSLEGEESIPSVALENSSATTDEITWVFDLITGVQGPGTSQPSILGLCSDLFTSIVASIFGLRFWVFLMMHGNEVGHLLLLLLCYVFI